jgi:uncharacterized protein YyaL (SSP411 family)
VRDDPAVAHTSRRKDDTVSNRLAGESSPYLLQHADNPVDWYPWGPEALARAKEEDKPIFLSIGYSACHWCHVMERESFSQAETASFLNAHFVCVKVDREERPDLDAIYMQALSALTGGGGWPLNMWLDPEGAPFYGGTYYPPVPRRDMPSFMQVLAAIAASWKDRREELRRGAAQMTQYLAEEQAAVMGPSTEPRPLLHPEAEVDRSLEASFDGDRGGWGSAPKFPQPLLIDYLLLRRVLSGDAGLPSAVSLTLDAMAAGGVYDHLGGGFHRYSTDERWLVPHFEKMLYDNALLALCYLHAWQMTGTPRYRTVVEETLEYLLQRMRHPAGGFFSAEDADSEGREGFFYLWTLDEIRNVLGAAEGDRFARAYGVTEQGGYEGAHILHLEDGEETGNDWFAAARAALKTAREKRVPPARDEKIVTSWNGLALKAFAEAARAFRSERYGRAAEQAGQFLERQLLLPGHRLARSWKDGHAAGNGFLEDHACGIDGLLALYQATFAEGWFETARGLADSMLDHFPRSEGGFYDTSDDHETLIVRPRSLQDSPTACGNSLAAAVLLKVAAYTGEDRYRDRAEETLAQAPPYMTHAPMMFGQWLHALLLEQAGLIEVAIVGAPAAEETDALFGVITETWRQTVVVAARPPGTSSLVPLLGDREPERAPGCAAWVCGRAGCAAPTADGETLRRLLVP